MVKLTEHLEQVHGLTVLQASPETLHEQDHLPGHGYGGHGWQHPVDDLFLKVDEEVQ